MLRACELIQIKGEKVILRVRASHYAQSVRKRYASGQFSGSAYALHGIHYHSRLPLGFVNDGRGKFAFNKADDALSDQP